jgi:hypothetical protein
MTQEHSEPVTLEIDDANGDFLSAMGGLHLGFQAPKKVKIIFKHYSATKKENRLNIHPYLVIIFQAIRDFFRWAICSRTLALQGLQIGTYETGPHGLRWKVRNIKPHQVTKAMVEMYAARGQKLI